MHVVHLPTSFGGTGTLIESTNRAGQRLSIVLTAQHVCPTPGLVRIEFRHGALRGKSLPGEVLWGDERLDVAVLQCRVDPPAGATYARLADEAPQQGATVELCGYGGGKWRHRVGRALGYQPHYTSAPDNLCVDVASISGDSGGPIFNDRGELIAVLWGFEGQPDNPTHTKGTHVGRVREYLTAQGIFCPTCPPQQQPFAGPAPQPIPRTFDPNDPNQANPAPRPVPTPTQPQPAPTAPADACKSCECDPAALKALTDRLVRLEQQFQVALDGLDTLKKKPDCGEQIAAIEKQISSLAARHAEPGPVGPQGPAVPAGPSGPAGAPGNSIDINQLEETLAKRLAGKLRVLVEPVR